MFQIVTTYTLTIFSVLPTCVLIRYIYRLIDVSILSSCVRRLLPKINIIVFCLWKGLKATNRIDDIAIYVKNMLHISSLICLVRSRAYQIELSCSNVI